MTYIRAARAEKRQLGFCQHHLEVGWQPAAALESGLASSTLCLVSRARPGGRLLSY